MAKPRNQILDDVNPRTYHCFSCCIQQELLLDDGSGRRAWIQDLCATLGRALAVDIHSFTVMHNHFHIILTTRPDLVREWSDEEVARRDLLVCPGTWKRRLKGIKDGTPPLEEEIAAFVADTKRLEIARFRLSNLSWFMSRLKEPIARRANKESGKRGHFWEGRFESISVVDNPGLLLTSIYVDLNQVRAGMVDHPEDAPYTSFAYRLRPFIKHMPVTQARYEISLAEFENVTLEMYAGWVDHEARRLKSGKKAMREDAPPIAERLGLTREELDCYLCSGVRDFRGTAIGTQESLKEEAERRNGSWVCSVAGRRHPPSHE